MTSPSERSISSRARRLMTAKAKQSVIPPEGPGTGQSGHPPIAIPMPRGITRRRIKRTSPTTMSFLDTTRNYHRPPRNPGRLQSAGVNRRTDTHGERCWIPAIDHLPLRTLVGSIPRACFFPGGDTLRTVRKPRWVIVPTAPRLHLRASC